MCYDLLPPNIYTKEEQGRGCTPAFLSAGETLVRLKLVAKAKEISTHRHLFGRFV